MNELSGIERNQKFGLLIEIIISQSVYTAKGFINTLRAFKKISAF